VANRFADGRFRWAVGIEDTFVPQVALGRRALDEYELTQHYVFWADDLRLAAEAGATTIRYGFPWYRLEPEPGRFVWDWADRVVDRLDELGLETIVDLVHYGTPLWLDNAALNHAFAERLAEYAHALAERYRGRLTAYTPLNEPFVHALFCGETGVWPPHLTGDDGFVKLTRALVRGIVAAQHAVAEATGGEATFVHVEATPHFVGDLERHADEVAYRWNRALVVQDLVTGRVDDDHPLTGWLRRHGLSDDDLAWSREHTAQPDVLGVNFYPHLSIAEYIAGEPVHWQVRSEAGADGLARVLRAAAERYGCPLFVTETSIAGSYAERLAWLEESVHVVARARADGVEVVGYTWWPLFHFVEWEYRESGGPVESHLFEMGLYDLRPTSVGVLERVRTPVVDRFAELAAGAPEFAPAETEHEGVG
jgi:beta-glucosidase